MSEYLQNPWSQDNLDLIKAWLTPAFATPDQKVWIIGDGSFSEIALTPGTLDWQPVFTTDPMDQYDEMGLFIAQIEPNDFGVSKLINQLPRFSGLPMFSIVISDKPQEQIKHMLTWLADGQTKDGLNIYLRIGDTRCLPPILASLTPKQKDYVSYIVDQWRWPGRDGLWNQGISTKNLQQGLDQRAISQSQNIIDDQQFTQLVDSTEVDLIYSLINSMDDEIYPTHFNQSDKYQVLSRLINEAKQSGKTKAMDIRDDILDRLVQANTTRNP